MKLKSNRILQLLLCLLPLFLNTLTAKDLPAKPNPPKLVNDFANVLAADQKEALEAKLAAYADSTSTQIAIVIENSLDGDDDFDYSQRLAEAWGIGNKKKDNGILIYVAIDDRKIRFQTGYGMEATVTDALCNRIIEEQIKPNFRNKDYYTGLNEATDVISRAASGEYINENRGKNRGDSPPPLVILLIIIIILIAFIFRNKGNGRPPRGFFGGPFYGTFGGGGFNSGGFGGGGGGGGGFGGFGGGSFGGGGAGGSW